MPRDTFYLCALTAQVSRDIQNEATTFFLSLKKATPEP